MDQTVYSKKKYGEMVKEISPQSHILANCLRAFSVGGTICVLGQLLTVLFVRGGLSLDDARLLTSVTLIFVTVLLTGLGWYDKIGEHAGAGSFVPITGFANSIAAPAVEFKKEGLVLGVGAKMFVIAGPVIVYGTMASVLVGLVYYFLK